MEGDCAQRAKQAEPWEAIQLPGPDEALSTLHPIGEDVSIKVNGYVLDTRSMKDVFLHEIPLTVHTDKKSFLLHLKGQNNDVMKQKRRAACWAMLEWIQRKHFDEFVKVAEGKNVDAAKLKDYFVFDGYALFYSTVQLQALHGTIDKVDFPAAVLELAGNRAERIEYQVKSPSQIWKYGADPENQRLRKNEVVLMFLSNLTWARLSPRHLHYGNKAFHPSHERQLMLGMIAIAGMEKTVRPMGGQLVMQIDAKVSPFFSEMPLLKHIEEQIGGCDRLRDARTAKRLGKALHGIAVETTHIKNKKTFQFSGFSSKNAASSKFVMTNNKTGEKQEISVKEYFLEAYKYNLQYPNLPLAKEVFGNGRTNHYPIEALRIVGGQRIPNSKSTPELIERLIKEAQMKPPQMQKHIEEQAYRAFLDGQKHLQLIHFGVKPLNSFMKVNGQIVAAPEIKMAGGRAAQRDGRFPEKWRVGQRDQFFRAAEAKGAIVCLSVDNCLNPNDARKLMDRLISVCKDRGMCVDPKLVQHERISSDPEAVASMMESLKKKGNVSIAVFITKNKRDSVHHTVKLHEARTGVLSQHMCLGTVHQILDNKPLCLNNVAQKINQKLGGVNFDMSLSPQLRSMNPEMFNRANWFNGRTLFIGLALSHAAPQSFADRNNREAVSPSVVGIAHTLKEIMSYRGEYLLQSARNATIENMTPSIVRALTGFFQSARDLPHNIVIFRAGTSEGEFKKAAFETDQVVAAFSQVQHLRPSPIYLPSVTTVVIISGSNYRAVTATETPDNVSPGTCLTRQAVNPDMKEFVMVPQRAIMGTARPIRCTVVREVEGRVGSLFTSAELKVMVNSLCHTHTKVTAPVHAPGVLMAAEELAKRGRNNYNEEHQGNDASTTVSGGSGGLGGRVDVTKEDVETQLSELNKKFAGNRLNQLCHFWA